MWGKSSTWPGPLPWPALPQPGLPEHGKVRHPCLHLPCSPLNWGAPSLPPPGGVTASPYTEGALSLPHLMVGLLSPILGVHPPYLT